MADHDLTPGYTSVPSLGTDVERHVEGSKGAISTAIARAFIDYVTHAIAERGRAHVSLTGGSMGTSFLSALKDEGADRVDWNRVVLWWGDERFVELDDPDRNDSQAMDALLGDLALNPDNVIRLATPSEASIDQAAQAYARELERFAEPGETSVRFDLMMLGIGPDCHVASLFPGRDQTKVSDRLTVAVTDSPKPPPERVSLTFPALNNSRQVWFIVAGQDKADAVGLATSKNDPVSYPASGVQGQEKTVWWLDQGAAGTSRPSE